MSAAAAEHVTMAVDIATALEDWGERQPLPDALPEVPALPLALLPAALRDWIDDASERLQVPPEMIAAPALVAAGAVIGRTVAILPRRRDDWYELPNLWGMVVGRPGTMKSPAVTEATRHIRRLAAQASAEHQAAERARVIEREAIEMQITAHRRAGASRKGDAAASARAIAELQTQRAALAVPERRYMTQDATTEKLGELLLANPRGLLVLRDELHGWLAALDKPGREGDRAGARPAALPDAWRRSRQRRAARKSERLAAWRTRRRGGGPAAGSASVVELLPARDDGGA